MATRASHLVASVRDSFWFLPGACVLVAIVLAETVVLLDRLVLIPEWAIGFVLEAGADGSRGLLTAIAGSMLGAAATMFSITIAVLALTSSSYGPRLVRNFMADRGNQLVLGGLVAISLYALLVVRHIRVVTDGEDLFVPHLAVNLAVVLLVLGIGLLIFFIHHIASDIQVSTLSSSVRRALIKLFDQQFPLDADVNGDDSAAWSEESQVAGDLDLLVSLDRDGYVGAVAVDELVMSAHRHEVRIDVLIQPGTYLVAGDTVARVIHVETVPPLGRTPTDMRADTRRDLEKTISSAITVDDQRTPYQDLEHLVRQLVDLSVRALSPGTNDPFTAINAIDDLSAAFSYGIARPDPPRVLRDKDGVMRVRVAHRRVADLVVEALDVMRPYACEHTVVVCRALVLIRRVVARASISHDRMQLLAAADRLVQAHGAFSHSEFDQQQVRSARAEVAL
jgi:uncharacterized membrane protein